MTNLARFFVSIILSIPLLPSSAAGTSEGSITGQVLINSAPAANAVVYLTVADGRPIVAAPVEKTIRQENIRFRPDFLIVPAGSTIRFENHDDEIHNIYSKAAENRFDSGAHVPHTVKTVTLKNPGAVPLRCRTHSTMRGMIFVAPSPYFATTDELGRFKINDFPAGTYRIMAWHPRLSPHEQALGMMEIQIGSEARTVELRFTAKAGAGTDLTETAGRDWIPLVDQIREELTKAVDLWKNGGITSAAAKVMSAQSRLYGESGLRDAITKHLGRSRADEHERRLDAFRKGIQGIGGGETPEGVLQKQSEEIFKELSQDAERMNRE